MAAELSPWSPIALHKGGLASLPGSRRLPEQGPPPRPLISLTVKHPAPHLLLPCPSRGCLLTAKSDPLLPEPAGVALRARGRGGALSRPARHPRHPAVLAPSFSLSRALATGAVVGAPEPPRHSFQGNCFPLS